jgi:hypothetical protein
MTDKKECTGEWFGHGSEESSHVLTLGLTQSAAAADLDGDSLLECVHCPHLCRSSRVERTRSSA